MPPSPITASATRRQCWQLVLAFVAASEGTAAAASNAGSLTAALEVAASPDCTTRADVIARVHARSPRVAFVEDGADVAVSARFSLLRNGAVAGELAIVRHGAEPSVRHVVAQSCAEAADAVALIIAVTLDPSSGEHGGAAERDAASAATADTNGTKNGSADGASRSPPAEPKARATAAPVADDGTSASSSPSPFSGDPRFGLLFAGQTFLGPAPGVMPGIALYATAGIDRRGAWSPALLLGAVHAWRSGVEEPGGTAAFTLNAVSLDLCPLRFRSSRLEVRPCASLLGGGFSARGTDTQNPVQESARPFWMLGAAGVVTLALVWRLEASARVAVGANLVRDSFEFSPVVFHEVAPVTLGASLGLGVRLP